MPLEDWPICTTMGTMGSRPTGHNSTRISRRARRSWSPRIGMGRSRRDRQMKDGFTYRGTEFDASGGSFMIDVHPRNRLTRAICRTPPPHGVIEGEHAVRAGRILQQALLGIVRPTDLVLVVEVAAYNSPAKNRGRLCVKIAVDWNALHFATTATKDDQITLEIR